MRRSQQVLVLLALSLLRRGVAGGLAAALTLLHAPPAFPAQADGAGPEPVGVWPLEPEPEVVAGFDPPDVVWGSGHRGVDLGGSPGQSVRAALAGTVAFAGAIGGKRVVVVRHGDTRTTYEPVASLVAEGDLVEAGDPLGWLVVAHSHCYPAACLHWGWRRGEEYLDPLALVGGDDDVRLLPLWRDRPVTPWGAPAGRPSAGGPW